VIIDVHHHLLADSSGRDYADGLVDKMDTSQVQVTVISGLGLRSHNWVGDLTPNNEDVAHAVRRHPDRLLGIGAIRLGDSTPDEVARLHDRGFVGLKTTRPRYAYDDHRFDEVYATAVERQLPILFHTGFIVGVEADSSDDVSSERCRPVHLDRVARTFPELTIIMAHLGMPWHEEAAQMCRFHPRVYTDLSGSLGGWRSRKPPEFFRDLFYWDGAWDKVLYGSDVHYQDMAAAIADYRRVLAGAPLHVVDSVLGGTAAHIFGLTER